MSELVLLHPEQVESYQPRIQHWIAAACSRSRGRYAPEHVFDFAKRNVWQLWLILEGNDITFVGATEIFTYPTGLQSFVVRLGTGKGRDKWQHHIDDALKAAKASGCTLAEGVFRRGWGRVLPGWSHTHDFLDRML